MSVKDETCHPEALSHKGIIQKIDDRYYYVSVIAQSACSACHAKGVCNIWESKEKIIEIPRQPHVHHQEGDSVEVIMKKSLGLKAVLIGYVIPFAILLISLLAAFKIFDDEGIAGIISLLILIPYYGLLYFFKDKLRKTFTFSLKS